jgi:hypothetical protein
VKLCFPSPHAQRHFGFYTTPDRLALLRYRCHATIGYARRPGWIELQRLREVGYRFLWLTADNMRRSAAHVGFCRPRLEAQRLIKIGDRLVVLLPRCVRRSAMHIKVCICVVEL